MLTLNFALCREMPLAELKSKYRKTSSLEKACSGWEAEYTVSSKQVWILGENQFKTGLSLSISVFWVCFLLCFGPKYLVYMVGLTCGTKCLLNFYDKIMLSCQTSIGIVFWYISRFLEFSSIVEFLLCCLDHLNVQLACRSSRFSCLLVL